MHRDHDAQLDCRLPSELKRELRQRAATYDATMNDVLITALQRQLDGAELEVVSLDYYARLESKIEDIRQKVAVLAEGFALFVRAWFQHHLPQDQQKRRERARDVERRYENFCDRLQEVLDDGGMVDDFVERPVPGPGSAEDGSPDDAERSFS